MEKIILNHEELKKLLSQESLSPNGNIFNADDKLFKIYRDYYWYYRDHKRINKNFSYVNSEQI